MSNALSSSGHALASLATFVCGVWSSCDCSKSADLGSHHSTVARGVNGSAAIWAGVGA